jgi:phosphopantothenoylcysteine decarboxylase/phosphopantothenate--cysteine ligase
MNCIVTAGPTYEPLDDVRRLTNFSTGRLGTELANFLVARGHNVTLLIGALATHSGKREAQFVKIFTTTADLRAKLKSLSGKKVDAIFHAAAVSDFGFGKMFTRSTSGKLMPFKPSKKISTRRGELLVELVPTPKIIAGLRRQFPKTKIIGWKYEADGRRPDAISSAQKQIIDCATDACVANGPAYGLGFGLVTPDGQTHFRNPPSLYAALEQFFRNSK